MPDLDSSMLDTPPLKTTGISSAIPYLDSICHTQKAALGFGMPGPSIETFEGVFREHNVLNPLFRFERSMTIYRYLSHYS
jgi:hypothetical protein